LRPKRIKDLLPKLAQELELSEKEIQSVLDVYWDTIRKTLSSMEYNRLYLKGLGTFYVKPWSVDKKLKVNNAVINKYSQNPTAGGLTIMDQLFKDNMKLEAAKRRESISNEKKEEKKNVRRNQNLEGEG
jgi:nucleoid DNA-binding protein